MLQHSVGISNNTELAGLPDHLVTGDLEIFVL